jgi:IS5 family transposase
MMVGRYTHAHQFKRARCELKFLRTRLGRIIRDVRRKIAGSTALEDRFGPPLDLALRVRHQEQRQRGPRVYWVHAPEVECIGKACKPYEFGCKAPLRRRSLHPRAASSCCTPRLARQPYDGHTLGPRPHHADLEKLTGDPPHPRRQGLPRPQLPRPIQGLDQRPGPPCHQSCPPRAAPPSSP